MSRAFLTPIALPADPTNPLEAVTKQYVDARTGSEVEISANDPIATNPSAELWYDTDAPAVLIDPTPAWIAPTLLNGWVNFGSGFNPAGYRKIGDVVSLRGLLTTGSTSVPMFNLPAGYRPAYTQIFTTSASDGWAEVRVGANGDVLLTAAANPAAWTALDGMQFSVSP